MAYFYEEKTALALNAEKSSQAVFFWLRDDVCVYVDASESSGVFCNAQKGIALSST